MILKTSKKVYEVIVFNLQKYVYSESLLNTLYIQLKHKVFFSLKVYVRFSIPFRFY